MKLRGVHILFFVLTIAVIGSVMYFLDLSGSGAALPKKIDYNFHVRPILSDKCFACHGPDEAARKGDIRLDLAEGAYAEIPDSEGRFAIIPGDPEGSELFHRIYAEDSSLMMPPPESELQLTDRERSILSQWIEQGAEYKPHWAFVLPESADPPSSSFDDLAENEIDHFVFAKLDELGLEPNERADKERLLKRVSFDLTGLPPDIELQEKFLQDDSENAYEKVVEELLSSPHYGEKMAVHWLDVARYADSHGYQDDGQRTMWPWRDWVIHAFNENYPYDKFVRMQLAGDLFPDARPEDMLATGFNRNHKITQEGGVIDEEYRVEYVTDRTNTFGKAFLGMTFECAKCHDHKYDPISKEDYFSTFAFFNMVPEKGLFGTIDASFADPPNMKITKDMVSDGLNFINLRDTMPVDVMVMKDSMGLRDTYVLRRGAYDLPGEKVDFSTPASILPFDTLDYEKNRLGLSEWLLDERNPLTARVFVNRIWQEIFGSGLVRTSGDFGMQGEFPSHPELLDWLALDFRENGWDVKYLVKKIVTSATYRQSSELSEEKLEKDPDNTWLSRSGRNRFKAEFVRDHVLSSSGLLNDEIGGPSVKPYQPEGIWESATSGRGTLQFYVQDHEKDLYRRGMYTFIKRTVPPPSMLMFDASNRDQCEVRRLNTNTPLQALVMMNDPTVLEASRVLAERLLTAELENEERIRDAFKRIVCRNPAEEELKVLLEYYGQLQADFTSDVEAATKFVDAGEYPHPENLTDPVPVAALMQVIHTIYNMEEAITRS